MGSLCRVCVVVEMAPSPFDEAPEASWITQGQTTKAGKTEFFPKPRNIIWKWVGLGAQVCPSWLG